MASEIWVRTASSRSFEKVLSPSLLLSSVMIARLLEKFKPCSSESSLMSELYFFSQVMACCGFAIES